MLVTDNSAGAVKQYPVRIWQFDRIMIEADSIIYIFLFLLLIMCNTILFIKRLLAFITLITVLINNPISAQTALNTILIETSLGNIKIILYEETPFHSENFIKLIKEGVYNDILFHRVIEDFMIQTGDPGSRNAQKGQLAGTGGVDYTVPAEFHPGLYHKKGALAAARQGDNVNPEKASSGSQFYIVKGTVFSDDQLDQMEARGMHIKFTEEQRDIYKTIGGTHHLDYAYTVFGSVVEGLDVVDKIAAVQTDQYNRPLEDVRLSINIID